MSRAHPVRHTGFELDVVIAAVTEQAEEVVSLRLVRPDGRTLPRWVPGAHVDLILPSGKQRQYSLCGSPTDRLHYRIAVRRIAAGGGGSCELHDLAVGELIRIRGPRNAFPFIDAASYLFIAGGIGITPILSMVRATAQTSARWQVVYLGRSRASMPFLAELDAIAGDLLDVRPDDEVGMPDVAELLSRAGPGAAVYVCGPPPLLDAVRELMPSINRTGSLHLERFSPPPVRGGKAFGITLNRTGVTVAVAADESALTAIRRELPGVAYSCQQGFCGTCRVGVLDGRVDHRDSVQLDTERADSMMICVSRATGDCLVLDL